MPFVVDDILIGLPSSFSSGLKSALQSLSVRSSYLFVSRRANKDPDPGPWFRHLTLILKYAKKQEGRDI